ncbi:MAG: cytochrome C oxidase subunit IV family protein [Planctomycetota bacterium]
MSAHHEHHISSPQLLWATFLALVALTVLTVAVSKGVPLEGVQVPFVDAPQDLRWLDMPITLSIATVKALLVAVIFMHLQHDKLFNSVLLAGSVIFLVLFVGMVLLDSNEYQPQVQSYLEDRAAMANP